MKSGIRRKEGETELRILVQSSQAGAIIGTKGTTVKTLREVRTSNSTPSGKSRNFNQKWLFWHFL